MRKALERELQGFSENDLREKQSRYTAGRRPMRARPTTRINIIPLDSNVNGFSRADSLPNDPAERSLGLSKFGRTGNERFMALFL